MLKKSVFFDFFNRRETDFDQFITESVEDRDYIDWNQFAMPYDYGDAHAEYSAVRNSCAICDVSPIRKIRIRGAGAGALLDHLLTRPVSQIASMRATYTVLCNQDGSLKDDAILYKFADDDYLMMPSDIDHSPYFESLRRNLEISDVSFTECTDAWAGLAVQGPLSAAVLLAMGFGEIEQLKPFEVRNYELAGGTLHISRMGFTADLGYECWFKPDLAEAVMQGIEAVRKDLDIMLPGYGLSALQVCRHEGGFIVAGWDVATEVDPNPGFERTPYELGLGWLVNLDKVKFVGRDALLEQKRNGHPFTLRTFEIDVVGSAPDEGAALYESAGEQTEAIGAVTSSSWSWGMGKAIGIASIRSQFADLDSAWVCVGEKRVQVTLRKGPLINLARRNQVPAPLHI